ncbi:O-antigen ligase family protein [uncultured Cardiobacterium sp.]|uniref:O-antigen ligase family protein n=1 Tax=uncultured Cardiobacterium sp. TaxID=417619 RepID=UPI00260B4213|nr:O-antigen ligase family protein [uncultured Cardiobacterium sp.]
MNATLIRLNNAAVFLTFALSIAVKGGYNYGAGILFLAALLGLPQWWKRRPCGRDLRLIALGFILMGTVALIDVWLSGLRDTYYNIPLKFLVMPLLLAYLAANPPDPRAIWWGAAAGAVLGLASALYYTHYAPELLPDGRAARYLHPIQLGNLAMLFALLCACSLRGRPRGWALLPPLAGILAGLYTVFLSQTRGSFTALAWTLAILAILSLRRRHFRARSVAISGVILLALGGTFWLGKGDIISERLAEARHDIALYRQGDSNTSIGARLEMWHFAWEEGSRYPVFGPGTARMLADKASWPSISQFGHMHNEFLDAFARRGSVGLLIVLYLFLVPLYCYRRHGRPADADAAALRLAGSAHILLYSGFSLTQAALYSHNSGFLFFALPLCMMYAAYRARGGA